MRTATNIGIPSGSMAPFIPAIIMLFLASCNHHPSNDDKVSAASKRQLFSVNHIKLSVDTPIRTVVFHKGYYILLHDDDTYSVLDTNYNRQPHWEKKLQNTGNTYLWPSGDSAFLGQHTNNSVMKEYSLNDSFELKRFTAIRYPKPKYYGELFFEDSNYEVYGCCAGEFGGSLFFYNKKNKRLFFKDEGCIRQVVWYRNAYYAFRDVSNFGGYTKIDDPQNLIELQYKNRLFSCNWWVEVDSMKSMDGQRRQFKGVTEYHAKPNEACLSSFVLNDTLFSIISADSSTYLAIVQGDSVKPVQTLMNKKLWFHYAEYYGVSGRRLVYFSASSTQGNSETKIATHSTNSGFIIVKGRQIDIAEYSTRRIGTWE